MNQGNDEIPSADASADAVETADVSGRITYVNDAWVRLFSRSRRDAIGALRSALGFSVTTLGLLRMTWLECLATGHSCGVLALGLADRENLPVAFNRWLHTATESVLTVYRPVTAEAPPEPRLPLGTDALTACDGAAIFDPQLNLTVANPELATLAGHVHTDRLELASLFQQAVELLAEVASGENQWGGELDMTRRDGMTVLVDVKATPYRHPAGRPLGLAVQTRSIAPQPRGRRAIAESGASYSPDIEHEVRNSLAAVLAAVEALDSALAGPAPREEIDLIKRAIRQASALLDTLTGNEGTQTD